MNKSLWLFAVLALCFWANPLNAQDFDECVVANLEVASAMVGVSEFDVDEDVTVVELNVRVQLTSTFVGYIDYIDLNSPTGTEVRLHDGNDSSANSGGWGDDMDLTYSDVGASNGLGLSTGGSSVGTASPYDCSGCLFQGYSGVATPDSLLSAFDGEPMDDGAGGTGTWEMELANGSFTNSTLDSWCLINYPLAPVADLTCAAGALTGEWELTWTNGDDYDRIDVIVNGEVIASESTDIGDAVPVVLASVDALPTPQLVIFQVVGVDTSGAEDVYGAPSFCTVALPAEVVASIEGEDLPATFDEFTPYIALGTFVDDVTIADIQVRLDANGDWIAYNDSGFWLTSADGTTVSLASNGSGTTASNGIDTTFWEIGQAHASCSGPEGSLDCEGGFMQARDSLRAFAGEDTINDDGDDTWVLLGFNAFSTITVDEWVVNIFDSAPAFLATITDCAQTDVLGVVEVTFEPGSDYSEIRIFANGALVDTLLPVAPDTFFPSGTPVTWNSDADGGLDPFDFPGSVSIGVQGFNLATPDAAPGPIASCSALTFVPTITSLACVSASGTGSVDLSWTNGYASYDGIDFSIEGIYESTETGDTTEILGRDTDADDVAFEVPSTVNFTLAPFVTNAALEDVYGDAVSCSALLLPAVDYDDCVAGGPDVLTSDIFVSDFYTISEVEAVTDITSGWESGLDIDLTSPVGTAVRLKDQYGDGTSEQELIVLWDDDGEAQSFTTDFSCACAIQPYSTAAGFERTMGAYINEASDGTWTLTVNDTASSGTFDPTNINQWCIRINGCTIAPPTGLTATWDDGGTGALDVVLDWVNPDTYLLTDGIEIYDVTDPTLDPILVDTIDGDSETATIEDLEVGRYRFLIRAFHPDFDDPLGTDPGDCFVQTDAAKVTVGIEEVCVGSPTAVDADPTFEATVTYVEPVQIAEVGVVFIWTSPWAPTLADITSPGGTTVELMGDDINLSVSGGVMDIIFDDDGTTLPVSSSGDATFGDGLEWAPSGDLSDFVFEVADGDWDLYGEHSTFYDATLDEFCVAITEGCTASPPSDIVCLWDGGLTMSLEWTNNGTYETLYVDIDGVEVAELDGADTTADVGVAEADVYSVRLRAYDATLDCTSGSSTCSAAIGLVAYCDEPDPNTIDAVTGETEFLIDIADDPAFEDVECSVQFSTTWSDGFGFTLANPLGESVLMQSGTDTSTGGNYGICTTYSDFGDVNNFGTPDSSYEDCDGKLQPHDLSNGAVGAMVDLAGGSATGEWSLSVNNTDGFYTATLDEWCVRLLEGCPIDAVTDITCTAFEGNKYPVTVSWTNNDPDDDYTSFDIFRNGELIATVSDPDAEEYSDTSGPGGQLVYTVNVYTSENDCFKVTAETCLVSIGRVGICSSDDASWSGPSFPGGGDSLGLALLDWADEDLADFDGSDEDLDLSPTEDGRVDIADAQVAFSVTTTFIGDWTMAVASPEGTTLTVWGNTGGGTAMDSEDSVLITDTGASVPSTLPTDCDQDTCQYQPPATAGEMADFMGEDAQGTWILVGQTFYVGSIDDFCVYIFPDEFSEGGDKYIRGDVDGSGVVSAIIDALRLLQHFFGDAAAPPCFSAADVDGSGAVSAIIDALRLLQHFFGDAAEPPAPFPACGTADPDYEYIGTEDPCETPLEC